LAFHGQWRWNTAVSAVQVALLLFWGRFLYHFSALKSDLQLRYRRSHLSSCVILGMLLNKFQTAFKKS
jgi:hypothetical protein